MKKEKELKEKEDALAAKEQLILKEKEKLQRQVKDHSTKSKGKDRDRDRASPALSPALQAAEEALALESEKGGDEEPWPGGREQDLLGA